MYHFHRVKFSDIQKIYCCDPMVRTYQREHSSHLWEMIQDKIYTIKG